MLGVPASPGTVGYALLALGMLLALSAATMILRRRPSDPMTTVLVICAAFTLGAAPFLVRRIVQDLRYTTGLDAYSRGAAGPIQAFLPGYLLDPVERILPAEATYATVVSDNVPYPTARKAFPLLALNTLFPRVSARDPRHADWIVAWGVDPRRVAPVTQVIVARKAFATNPTIYVAKVRH